MKPVRVQIVEDHPAIQMMMEQLLSPERFQIVSTPDNVKKAIADSEHHDLDFVLLDLIFPGASGEMLIQHYKKLPDPPRILIYSSMSDLHLPAQCVRAGAHGFVNKGSSIKTLHQAIETVAIQKKEYIPTALKNFMRKSASSQKGLTPRESEVGRLVALGHSNHSIAWELNISERTVNIHRSNMMRKLDAHNLKEVIQHSLQLGLITQEDIGPPK